ncbi:MAG: leader peptidase (prepilin peptidase) / N-methyltransferase, partial [Solirubrobacteraceae bacterium]|nr:leader peptidase (prepilin peptidase) / N-methyltransferase [Solirubrobacteraceae bacterium]
MLLALLGAVVGGLVAGSLLNVVAVRVAAGGSLADPARCPRCKHPLRARDNVPLLSWLLLRGRCRDCHAPISRRYPLVEAGTALLFV